MKKKETKEAKYISASLLSFTQYTSALSRCIQNLKTFVLIEAEKSVSKNLIAEKEKKGQIKGMISIGMLNLSYMIQLISKVCTKFQNPRCSSLRNVCQNIIREKEK